VDLSFGEERVASEWADAICTKTRAQITTSDIHSGLEEMSLFMEKLLGSKDLSKIDMTGWRSITFRS
jgi:hypothetical protein